MKIYVAACKQDKAQMMASTLDNNGFDIVSTWVYKVFKRTADYTEEEREAIAVRDTEEVKKADAMVLISDDEYYAGGKFVEAGVALGLGIPILVLGRRENILLWHKDVQLFNTREEVLAELQRLREKSRCYCTETFRKNHCRKGCN